MSEEEKGRVCQKCGRELKSLVPWKCKRCGNLYCNDHRLPESHECIVLKSTPKSIDRWKYEESKFKKDNSRRTHTSHSNKPRYEEKHKRDNTSRRDNHRRRKPRRKYTTWQTIRYKFRRANIPEWFVLTIIAMVIVAFLHQQFELPLGIISFPTIFYILELIVVAYFMFRLIKILDRIHVGSDLRLFGLRLLSGVISLIGLFILYMLFFGSFVSMLDENVANVYYFGKDFGLPLTGYFIFFGIAVGLSIIGAYLYFKFKRRTGTFHWIGRA